ncbi:MAG: sugar phosphate isomerase/epimerase family protein [Planctomycetia bacterium]|nr:sugar phosphate isomerase/epimerase family protein [Planctomycetia bacterium]
MKNSNRRQFLKNTALLGSTLLLPTCLAENSIFAATEKNTGIKFGLCTYLWGKDDDLPTLITNCEKAGLAGVELRVEHKHLVEPELTADQRKEVRKRFADSPVKLVGFGTNEAFHYEEADRVKACIERAKAYVKLSADCGGLGVKVKPNDLPKKVAHEKTFDQIAKALEELGRFAADYGQEIRLENHGQCARIPYMKAIIDRVSAKNVGLCWNCNTVDYEEPGLTAHFRSVRNRLASTMHVHEIPTGKYPFDEFVGQVVEAKYQGWFLFECHKVVKDYVSASIELRKKYQALIDAATKGTK